MFAKNFLSIISLIAVGGITKTLATNAVGMTSCTSAGVTDFGTKTDCTPGAGTTYCIDGNGIIFGYEGTDSTCAINAPGIYAFTDARDGSDNANQGSTNIVLGSTSNSITASELLLYRCSYGHENKLACDRTYGYALINDKIYVVKSDNSVEETEISSYTGADPAVDCKTAAHLGKITNDKKLCIKVDAGNPIVSVNAIGTASDPLYYIMENKNTNIFTGATDNGNIILEAQQYAIVLDKDVYDYCVDATTNQITPTFKEFCDNAADGQCTVLAEHSTGVWTRSDTVVQEGCTLSKDSGSSVGCTQYGYYIAANANGGTPTTSGVLFHCSAADTCTKESKVGYFKYADKTDKYIKCTDIDDCVEIDVTEKTNCSIAENDGDVIKSSGNEILCLDNSVEDGIPITVANNNKEFFVPNGSIFLSGKANKYAKVTVKTENDASITLSDAVGSTVASKYVYTDKTFLVYSRGSAAMAADVCTDYIREFKYVESTEDSDLYEVKVEYKWPSI